MKYLSAPIDVEQFQTEYLDPLQPVVFGSWLTKEWGAATKWRDQTGTNPLFNRDES